jgi:hypothetical protein
VAERTEQAVGYEIVSCRPHDDLIEDEIYEDETDDGRHQHKEYRTDDMPPKGLEVVDEAHFGALIFHTADALEEAFSI